MTISASQQASRADHFQTRPIRVVTRFKWPTRYVLKSGTEGHDDVVDEDEEADEAQYEVTHQLAVVLAVADDVRDPLEAAREQSSGAVEVAVLQQDDGGKSVCCGPNYERGLKPDQPLRPR